jgi:Domain of unknown function (DUF4157)
MSEYEHEQATDRVRQGGAAERAEGKEPADLRWAATLGNKAVRKLLQVPRLARSSGAGSGPLDERISREIESRRGGGAGLDSDARADLEQRMGEDFSDVRVHSGADADGLSRAVQAEAFTTGTDIFFRDGNYRPESSKGRELLAHELTHVVQQRGAPPPTAGRLEVTDPGDATESEAHDIARAVTAAPASVSRMPTAEEETPPPAAALASAPVEEVAPLRVQREAAPEEEEDGAA